VPETLPRPVAFTIRPAEPFDVPALVAMAGRFLQTTVYARFLTSTPAKLAALVETVLAIGVVLVAEVEVGQGDGARFECVGMIALVSAVHPVSGEPFVDELAWWVEPAWRGSPHGLGTQLLAAAEAWATERGVVLMKMVAPVGSPEVGAFYERRGYACVETVYQKRLQAS
jgi:GNAT superfamily N-acetyltransferase